VRGSPSLFTPRSEVCALDQGGDLTGCGSALFGSKICFKRPGQEMNKPITAKQIEKAMDDIDTKGRNQEINGR
jgi:hypothetical protein